MQCAGDQDPGQCVGRGTLSSPSRPLHCCPLPCPASTIQPQLSRAPHILTLTQIIFQHCTTPRTHTQPSPSTSNWNSSVSGWRLGDEAIFHHGGQLTLLTFGKFGFSSSYSSLRLHHPQHDEFKIIYIIYLYLSALQLQFDNKYNSGSDWKVVLSLRSTIPSVSTPSPPVV